MKDKLVDIFNNRQDIVRAVFSQPNDNAQHKKVVLRPLVIKGELCYQLEQYSLDKVYHANITTSTLNQTLQQLAEQYNQVAVLCTADTVSLFRLPNGKVRTKVISDGVKRTQSLTHNRTKNYILQEGMNIPALVDLGVFDKQYRIIKSKHDKFVQINKFVEIVEHSTKNLDKEHLTIVDFGCGKSYLTFVLYYYLCVMRNKNVDIVGYDLKADVVEHCNKVASKYGYQQHLHFVVGNVADIVYDKPVDMMVTLHACDTATDYALNFAITNGVKYVFSVPCCQHEINLSIHKGGDMDILLENGLIKERVSALLTDAVRVKVLNSYGYDVDVVEFVDMEHSPKNMMIRATLVRSPKPLPDSLLEHQRKYGYNQTLLRLLKADTKARR